jgi:hypothetical protein
MDNQDRIQAAPSPREQLSGMIWGFAKVQLIYVAAKLKIADLLKDGPQDAATLGRAAEVDPQIMYRLMRGLAWSGLVTHQADDRFALTPLGTELRSDDPDSLYYNALSMGELDWSTWSSLLYTVETGKPGFEHTFGMEIFEYFAQNEAAGKRFDGLMGKLSEAVAADIVGAYDFSKFKTFVDIGGGNGALVIPILQASPHLRGIIFDLPNVVERTRADLENSPIADRCEAVGGDFFEAVPSGSDLYIMKWVMHNWPDDKCVAILKNCRTQMAADAKLVVVEQVMPPQATPETLGVMWDLHMLVMLNGIERTESEFRALFASAGFKLTRVIPIPSGFCMIEGAPVINKSATTYKYRSKI